MQEQAERVRAVAESLGWEPVGSARVTARYPESVGVLLGEAIRLTAAKNPTATLGGHDVQEPGKIQGASGSNDAAPDPTEPAASITCEVALIGGEWVIASIRETGIEQHPRVTLADLSGDAAREAVLDAIHESRAAGNANPRIYLTVPLTSPAAMSDRRGAETDPPDGEPDFVHRPASQVVESHDHEPLPAAIESNYRLSAMSCRPLPAKRSGRA
ncbi:hypothetical protein [Paractinoplanes rishiriensis]|uniref:Uncharacterized protein n=1 Tax=Paractinoplanes rishiriensis TaxID=1050105 RepID=A0A919K6L0_9ACTN|nr:hypothetical protein [Actinoplanes rishiriensis]GIF01881.1 hypothetical protein Ari01nite_93450 [Actinoplanes rishiriensis]